jgi:hypothetical protein
MSSTAAQPIAISHPMVTTPVKTSHPAGHNLLSRRKPVAGLAEASSGVALFAVSSRRDDNDRSLTGSGLHNSNYLWLA